MYMNKIKLLSALLLFATLSCSAQKKQTYDTLRAICEGPVFTTCEEMPYLKNGAKVYADSIKKYLAGKTQILNPGKISLQLAILRNGEIKYVEILNGDMNTYADLIGAVKDISNQWMPGKQNGYLVCCYRKLYIELLQANNIKITVPDRL